MSAFDLSTPAAAPAGPPASTSSADYSAIKQKQQAVWAGGDYAVLGVTLQIVGETLAEAADICAGESVIDIAAGNGNATLAAARRFAEVTAIDYVPQLLAKGAARAAAEGLNVKFEVADAEALPYPDACFDVALSTFGSMFVPDHRRAASEMLRVVASGGRIGLASWTPEGFIGRLFKMIGAYVPPAAGLPSPLLWGTESYLADLFGPWARDISCTRRNFNFRYRCAAHWVEVFRNYYGPVHKAFNALDAAGRQALQSEIIGLLNELNVAGARALVVPGEYLEAVISKKG